MYGVIYSLADGETRPWVARITGFHPDYLFQREFVRGVYDYSYVSRSNRRRNIYMYFAVPPGLYDVQEYVNTSRPRRYFAQVNEDGDVSEISKEELIKCLKNTLSV